MHQVTILLLILVLGSTPSSSAEKAFILSERYTDIQETLRIGPEPDELINMTERGHTMLVAAPDVQPIGVVVFFQRGKISVSPSTEPGSFDHEAFARGFAVLHVATANPVDFFFGDSTMTWAAGRIEEVLEKHNLRSVPIFFAGLSLGGTRALRFAAFLGSSNHYWLKAAGVVLVDSPLDMQRLWHAEKRAAALGFHPAAAGEGRWVTYLLETNLGGSPQNALESYAEYSPYMFSATQGGNAIHFAHLPIRAYHEPDVNWWIDNRRKSYYSMNSIDMAGLINELKILGNEDAELITTWQQRAGFDENASPHTWSFVDNAELAEWLLRIAKKR